MRDNKSIVNVEDIYTLEQLLDVYKQRYERTHILIGYRHKPLERKGMLMLSERSRYDNKY